MTESIAEDWGLSFSDLVFLADLPGDMQLEVALQISHLLRTGRFIEDWSDLAGDVVSYVASQIERPADRPTSLFDDRQIVQPVCSTTAGRGGIGYELVNIWGFPDRNRGI